MTFNISVSDCSTETRSVLVIFFCHEKDSIYCHYVNNINALKRQNAMKLSCVQAQHQLETVLILSTLR